MKNTNNVYQITKSPHDNLRQIKADLNALGINYKINIARTEFEVQECPFCDGNLSKPDNQYKLNINYEKLVYHCFRCGESGHYNKFKEELGLKKVQPKTTEQPSFSLHEQLWQKSESLTSDVAEPARKYFISRGLAVPDTDRIRFLAEAKYYDDKVYVGTFYAVISRIEDHNGDFIGAHLIYLDENGNKAQVRSSKKIMGKAGGGHVLFGPKQSEIAVAEGIETALAIYQATGISTYACISAGGLKQFEPPAGVKRVDVFSDNDASNVGQKAAYNLANHLYKKKVEVYVHIPDPAKYDLSLEKSFDFLDEYNFDKVSMSIMVKTAPPYDPSKDFWVSPMRKEAFHGVVGKYISRIFEFTEADKNALCIQFLILFGAMIGRKPYFQISSTRHFANLFAVIVGETSTGRKGMGLSNCKSFFKSLAEDFVRNNISDGLATGEGVIHRLRDKKEEECDEEPPKDKKNANNPPAQKKKRVVDVGVEDKRLLINEPEFVQVINASSKQGSILSGVIRKLWDCDSLANLSKGAAETATDPYVSIIGQITPMELTKTINEIDFSNGLGNRFMWVMSRSSKLLPLPPDLSKVDLRDLSDEVRDALRYAQMTGPMQFTPEAEQLWRENYIKRQDKLNGILGSLTARFAPQVLRISMIYALLDKQSLIGLTHLKAALAVWDYCQESTAFLFGGLSQNPVARKILYQLEKSEKGLTRTEIRDLFSGHKSADEIEEALRSLQEENLADSVMEPTKGRSIERWYAI